MAASDLLIKGHKDGQVVLGNTLTDDPFPGQRFDYLLANPPFGVDWKAERKIIDRWPNFRGYGGKLPRINDGALLFLLLISAATWTSWSSAMCACASSAIAAGWPPTSSR